MDIHAPHGPVSTFKDVIVHLGIVTVGILIALSLEGAREWHEHRTLVADAHENLTAELRDNRKEIAGYLSAAGETERELDVAYGIAGDLLKGKTLKSVSLDLTYHGAELRTASRTTAEVTGAFGLMKADDVTRYARAYDRQAVFEQAQNRAIAAFGEAFSGVRLLKDGGGRASPQDFELWKRQLATAGASIDIARQVAAELAREYDRALGGK